MMTRGWVGIEDENDVVDLSGAGKKCGYLSGAAAGWMELCCALVLLAVILHAHSIHV